MIVFLRHYRPGVQRGLWRAWGGGQEVHFVCACVNGPLCVCFQLVLCMHECCVRFCSLGSTFTHVYLLKSAGDKHAGIGDTRLFMMTSKT